MINKHLDEGFDGESASHYFSERSRWIWSSKSKNEDWWMFRKVFFVPSNFKSARLLVTAASLHETYMNGNLVARGPGRSFDFAKSFDEIDITHLITPGEENIIAVLSSEIGGAGILAEIVICTCEGVTETVSTDSSWKVIRNLAFKAGLPHSLLSMNEECFDARKDLTGWHLDDYNDRDWEYAREIGPVGIKPWTGMERSRIGLLSNDVSYPVRFHAIEMASLRKGYHFRLASPGQCAKVFITEITMKEEASIRLFFSEVGALSSIPKYTVDGNFYCASEKIKLTAGRHLLSCSLLSIWTSELELIIETDDFLEFLSNKTESEFTCGWSVFSLPGVDLKYPWHDPSSGITGAAPDIESFSTEILTILHAKTMADLPDEILRSLSPAIQKETSLLHDVTLQKYYKTKGGFTAPEIENGQPRLTGDDNLKAPLLHPENLLHGHVNTCTIRPQKDKDVHFVIDFDTEIIGHVEISLDAPAGTIVDIQCFEVIDGGGIAWMSNHNGFRYICREGKQTYTSHYRRGFRYLSVTLRNFERPVLFEKLCCHKTAYPVQEIGSFESSDQRLNQIYRISADTAKLCMLDTYVDCPGHEQNFWVGDARITAMINLLNFGAYDLNQRSIRLVGQSLSPEWVKAYWPNDDRYTGGTYLPIAAFPNYPEGGLPMWTFLWILQCWDHYIYGGNLEDLEENYGYVVETLRRCKKLTNERGLFDMPGAWNLIEWANNDLSAYGEVTANNVFLAACYRTAAKMSRILGDEMKSQKYGAEAERTIEAVNLYCWDDTRKAYVDTVRDDWAYKKYVEFCLPRDIVPDSFEAYASCIRVSEQSNTLAILFECVPEERLAAVMHILERVRNGNYIYGAPAGRSYGFPTPEEAPDGIVAIGSPFFLFFSLGALFQHGNHALALEVIRRDWGKMVDKGTKTCWETFMMNEKTWTRSICHAWSAAPAVYLPTYILGIRPIEPGYRKFIIDPFSGDLKWARGTVATPFGPIYVNWQRNQDGEMGISWSAPDECTLIYNK